MMFPSDPDDVAVVVESVVVSTMVRVMRPKFSNPSIGVSDSPRAAPVAEGVSKIEEECVLANNCPKPTFALESASATVQTRRSPNTSNTDSAPITF
jgi:hypothetical protein